MMKTLSTSVFAMFIAMNVNAQTANSDSESQSASQSYLYQEAGEIPRQAPGVGAPGIMHTGPCIVSTSGAISGPGFGVSLGGGRLDEACDTRAGAAALSTLIGNHAAIEHLCLDPKMHSTLAPMGYCTIHTTTPVAPVATTLYISCRVEGRTPYITVPADRINDAAYVQAAGEQCFATR